MKIDVQTIKENADGSFSCVVDIDEESMDKLIAKALVDSIRASCEEAEKYVIKEEDNEH
jgi:hypothetical protein